MAKSVLKNTSAGARGVRLKSGELVMIEAGQTVADLDLDDQELEDALAGDFEKGKAGDAPESAEPPAGNPPVPDGPPENEANTASTRAQRGR